MTNTIDSELKTMGTKAKIVIIDDHPVVLRGLIDMLGHEPDLDICGGATDPTEAIQLIRVMCPDVAIIDLSLQGGHGITLIDQIKLLNQGTKMLVFSVHDETLFAERVLRAGAMGYVSKLEPIDRLIEALRTVLAGRIHLSPAMATRMLHSVVGGLPLNHDPIQSLSNRELQVFQMIGEGMPTKKIAVKLHLSRKTVEAHREKIKSKLSLANSSELNRRAVQWTLENR